MYLFLTFYHFTDINVNSFIIFYFIQKRFHDGHSFKDK